MRWKAFLVVFEGLSFGEKIKIADRSFKDSIWSVFQRKVSILKMFSKLTITQKQQIIILYYYFFTRKSTLTSQFFSYTMYQVPCIWQESSAFHVYPETPRTQSPISHIFIKHEQRIKKRLVEPCHNNIFNIHASKILDVDRKHSLRKSVPIRSYSGPYFPAFGINTERYSVSLRI